jgi:hypothetical protein
MFTNTCTDEQKTRELLSDYMEKSQTGPFDIKIAVAKTLIANYAYALPVDKIWGFVQVFAGTSSDDAAATMDKILTNMVRHKVLRTRTVTTSRGREKLYEVNY